METDAPFKARGGVEHYRLQCKTLAFRNKSQHKSPNKHVPEVVFHQSSHRLPYFAHQQLDPAYFPHDVGRPAGGPMTSDDEYNRSSNDEDSEGGGADIDSDADDDYTPNKLKRRRKFESSKIANAAELKKMKIQGGRPAVAKKVTADLDSDDELIVSMKEARYLEKDIAQALVDQGRTAYNPKTIGTRWRRIKAALQKRQDDLLDADLTDWHEGDDDALLQAMVKVEKEVKKQKDEIEAKKWRMVADQLKTIKPVVNFSQHACRDRYNALQTHTAKPTPESVVNPSEEILERIRSRKEKERRIADGAQLNAREQKNVEANGWTSRMRTYF